ncbi:hypothetical protein K501DRAFT_300444, partial [Backusella circina FSU 941]
DDSTDSFKDEIWHLEERNQNLQQKVNLLEAKLAVLHDKQARLEQENESLSVELGYQQATEQETREKYKSEIAELKEQLLLLKATNNHLIASAELKLNDTTQFENEQQKVKEDRKFVFENTFKKLWRSKHKHPISLDYQRHFLEPPSIKRYSDITPVRENHYWEYSKLKLNNSSSSASASLINLRSPSPPPIVKYSDTSFEKGLNIMEVVSNGNWLFKFTRKFIGNSISNKKHQRFFWIHPPSQMLYWSEQDPGSIATEIITKSALIESFVILDTKLEKSSLPSILIKTSQRNIRVQCLDMTTHCIWSEP